MKALAPYPRSEYAVKKHIQEYYAIISHLDEQVGKIINHLEKEDLLEKYICNFHLRSWFGSWTTWIDRKTKFIRSQY